MAKEQTYYIKGMHCAACEVLIEKKLLEIPGVEAVDASTAQEKAVIEYKGEKPTLDFLNAIFKKDNYIFSESKNFPREQAIQNTNPINHILYGFAIALSVIAVFLVLDKMGVSGFFNIHSQSSVFSFFGLGLLAGISSCAALVGGIVLSLSKQWNELYAASDPSSKKLQPHILFNAGRVVSYSILGGALGLIGSRLSLSFTASAWLIIGVSLFMIAFACQMLGIKAFRKLQISLPKSITHRIADEKKFQGKYMPFVMGAATFFLPCGFTITAQTISLLSGSALQGALIMGLFALGTAPMLLLIGISSVKLFSKPHLAPTFSNVAGFLVLFFALYNIWSQLQLLGIIG